MRSPNERLQSRALAVFAKIDINTRACVRFFHDLSVAGRTDLRDYAKSFSRQSACPDNSLQIGEQRRLRFLVGQGFGALLASFHDELVECRIDGQGIIAVETRQTKTVQRFPGRADHAFDVEIAETVHTQVFADVFHRHLVCDQFFGIREIDAVMAGETDVADNSRACALPSRRLRAGSRRAHALWCRARSSRPQRRRVFRRPFP